MTVIIMLATHYQTNQPQRPSQHVLPVIMTKSVQKVRYHAIIRDLCICHRINSFSMNLNYKLISCERLYIYYVLTIYITNEYYTTSQ